MTELEDVSEPTRDLPVNQGESAIDRTLTGIDGLTAKRFIKHWHVCQTPEEELSGIAITFVDLTDGTIDTLA